MNLALKLAGLLSGTLCLAALKSVPAQPASSSQQAHGPRASETRSLDGEWLVAADAKNVGRDEKWWLKPAADAKGVRVPGIFQEVLTGYHGVAWYWRDVKIPANACLQGRYLLRFWMVDYKCEVWVNGEAVGDHEGGEDMFTVDITTAVRPDATNRIVLRVLNPTNERIDGIVLAETPHRNKTAPYSPGSDFNYGGITDSVELLLVPPVRVEDLFVQPDTRTGVLLVQAQVRNAGAGPAEGRLAVTAAPAASGETLAVQELDRQWPPGDTSVEVRLPLANPRLWDLNDPFLYRVTARVQAAGSDAFDERSTRCGFRDFRFERGYFRLNGRRLFLRSSHTGADSPVGVRVPLDPDLLRRDLLNVKVMGFNTLRFISGIARRYQLDLADELGLLVYEECFAGWLLGDSGQMPARFDHAVAGMIRRDRHHPSIVMWGLLNETSDGAVFRHAVASLPLARSWDESRVVMLNSGRFDGNTTAKTLSSPATWRIESAPVPSATRNGSAVAVSHEDTTWAPGQFALHPGINGEYAVVRWTAPTAGGCDVSAKVTGLAAKPTTVDLHLFLNGTALFEDFLNLRGRGNTAEFASSLELRAGDRIDAVVGMGDDGPFSDTTALSLVIKPSQGAVADVAADFNHRKNPNGVWSYGYLAPGPKPNLSTFALFAKSTPDGRDLTVPAIGGLSNPGSHEWEDVLGDQHPYQRVPHTAPIIKTMRTLSDPRHHLFVSEYGVGSALDLPRLTRHYERLGRTGCEDARVYRGFLEAFMGDWARWKMSDVFASPEDYFRQCVGKMGALRLLGINALRANPNVIGYSLTGTMDQGLTAEGLTTTFRELKPGTVDALFEAFYPLRWCLFAEPVQAYRKSAVRFEAVLANEDWLAPGQYPARFQVVGPGGARVFDRTVTVTIPELPGTPPNRSPEPGAEQAHGQAQGPAFALPIFSESVVLDGPPGKYRFVAALEQGGPASGETGFYVADAAEMPPVNAEVVLWGADEGLAGWLKRQGIRVRPSDAAEPVTRELLLVPAQPAGDSLAAWQGLARRIARGSTAVFLSPEVFKRGDNAVGWVPLEKKGQLRNLASWVYLKDEWTKNHPVFEGLPAGGLMDYTFYRDIIPDVVWSGQDPPAEVVVGAVATSLGYGSGLMMSVHHLGAGRFILNTLRIRDNLGSDPVAERLLRNALRYAARQLDQPAAELPADFQARLHALGYE